MNNKKIVVALKYYKGELNPFDGSALENALLIENANVIVVAMAPRSVEEHLTGLTRLGVKAVLVTDNAFAGSDTWATSLVLSKVIKEIKPDFVFCGRQSVDGDTAQIPPMLAKRLDYGFVTNVMEVQGGNLCLRNGMQVLLSDNTVVAFEKTKNLRFPSIFSKIGDLEIISNENLQIPLDKCGLNGSTTRVVKTYESTVGRRFCQFKTIDELSVLINSALSKENKDLNAPLDKKLNLIYYVGNVEKVAKNIANKVVKIDCKNKNPEEIAEFICKNNVRYVIWEDSDELKTLASQVAVITNAGLCADCISFGVKGDELIMTRPANGGSVTADIVGTSAVTMATVRTAKKDCADVVFSIGKGAISKKEEILKFAEKFNADVCCSRIVADSGKMPYSAQVGLTGKTVSPKVYVAFGISGAVQHTCAISGAGTVIAINKDKNERIFDYADFGIVEDIDKIL